MHITKWGYQEVPRDSVTLSKKLGEGQFGEVYKAELKVSKERSLDVAVKLVKKGAPAEERTKLLQEAANLGQFKHDHVVRLMGVVTMGRTSEFAPASVSSPISLLPPHFSSYFISLSPSLPLSLAVFLSPYLPLSLYNSILVLY